MTGDSKEPSVSGRTFTFVQLGDPQIGMGEDDAEADGRRLLEAVRQANAIHPEFILVSGDLTHRREDDEYDILESALSQCNAPLKIIPGNHDIFHSDDRDGLLWYRERFGEDRYRFSVGNWAFICLNSIVLDLPNRDRPADFEESRIKPTVPSLWREASSGEPSMVEESRRQWKWLEEKLVEAQDAGRRVILHMHVPPFIAHESEGLGYFNLPVAARAKFLNLVRKYGVRTLLAGHTHTTTELSTPDFTLLTVGGTARALDDRGVGYRVFHVDGDRMEQRFVRI